MQNIHIYFLSTFAVLPVLASQNAPFQPAFSYNPVKEAQFEIKADITREKNRHHELLTKFLALSCPKDGDYSELTWWRNEQKKHECKTLAFLMTVSETKISAYQAGMNGIEQAD